ncbi:MAG: radical SAM protein [Phycisphaerae bacterium]|nr:radical SAM protein [Phycisphaerae bacterium]
MKKVEQNDSIFSQTEALADEHWLERWLSKGWVRKILGTLSKDRPGGIGSHLERALQSYGNKNAPQRDKFLYWPIHKIMERIKTDVNNPEIASQISEHQWASRSIIAFARSINRYGLTVPQSWSGPLFLYWDFTTKCNLKCGHCYRKDRQDIEDELDLKQKFQLIDQFAANYGIMVIFGGGEPTLSNELESCIQHCKEKGLYTSLHSHGGFLSTERCEKLKQSGLDYIEVSIESANEEYTDKYRGVSGSWGKSIDGIRNGIASGLNVGMSMCVRQDNLAEVKATLQLAQQEGVCQFTHINFVPAGQSKEQMQIDLSPIQRKELMELLAEYRNKGNMGIASTAPQYGIHCADSLSFCGHSFRLEEKLSRVIGKYLGGCTAGRTSICVGPGGDVTPCVFMPERIMGNIKESKLIEIFQTNPWRDLLSERSERQGNCGSCKDRYYCGGCRARAQNYLNRMDHSDPGCILNQKLWSQLHGSNGQATTMQVDQQKELLSNFDTPSVRGRNIGKS